MPRGHVALVGAGAAGSPLALHLARMPEVDRLTIVDLDTFTEANLWGQEITRADVGKPKALAVAARVRQIRHNLRVDPLVCSVEHAPAGRLAADVLIAALDNRPARRVCNELAFRRSIPVFIDAGVRPEHLLSRVTLCSPAMEGATCYLCGWGPADWAAYQASYTCRGPVAAPATASPSYLSAMAASMAAHLCQSALRGELPPRPEARQLVYSAALHRSWETTIARNPQCRFDHQHAPVTRLERAPERYTLAAALRELGGPIAVPGMTFLRRLSCEKCGETRDILMLEGRLAKQDAQCANCGTATVTGALDRLYSLDASLAESHGAAVLKRKHSRFGLLPGDLLECRRGLLELGGPPPRKEEHP